MSLILGNTVISGITTPLNGSIAIGQIISSIIPLTDAGLHLLDGSVIQGGGIYDAFVQYIANLVNIYPQCFTDETTWQNTVNSKGVCGKFVYNSVNNTVRLPKITGFIEGTVDSNTLGDLVEAGLPNITGSIEFGNLQNISWPYAVSSTSGAFYSENSGYVADVGTNSVSNYNHTGNFDASLSNPIYGNSNTVQPQSIKVFYYIVIATTTKTDIEVDIDEVITDLNTIDSNAVHKTGNETITGVKTFKGNNRITAIQNSTVTYNTAPSSNTFTNISFRDKNGYEMGVLEHVRYPNNDTVIRLVAKGADGEWSTSLSVGRRANGTVYTSAQTPSAGDNSTNIATTAWVNTKFQVVSTLPANPDNNIYYCIPE